MSSAVVSVDGLAIASELRGSGEARRMSAMAAVMLSPGEQSASEFEHDGLERVFVTSANAHSGVTAAGPDAVLSLSLLGQDGLA